VKDTAVGLSLLLMVACATSTPRQKPTTIPLAPPPRPLKELVQQLSDPDAASRATAAWSLAGAKKADTTVVHALRNALDDPSVPVREAATWALAHIKGGFEHMTLMDSPPKVLVQTKPLYPPTAFKDKLAGTVMIEILISELGNVAHAEIRESVPGLDEAALASVRDWRFEPATRGGKPVACVAFAPVVFRYY